MSLLQNITDFFENIFMSSSPEVKKKQALRRIEQTLKESNPPIYRGGMIQVSFAEALRSMFDNAKVIGDILSSTICSEDLERNDHFAEQLIFTGFDEEEQEILANFSYDSLKEGAKEAASLTRYFEGEHRKLEKIIKELNSPDFIKIDSILDQLKQLNDICRYGYVTALKLFDVEYNSSPSYAPKFGSIPPDLMERSLLDMYYVCADMDISKSLAQAILALDMLEHNGEMTLERQEKILGSLKRMQSLIHHVFNNQNVANLIRIAKKSPDYEPQKAIYKGAARQQFAKFLETKFSVDESRLRSEIQDETILSQVKDLFGDRTLEAVTGYNEELNKQLKMSTDVSFQWVLPYQVLKTFVISFYEEHAKPLLNDIVIEGFFNNPSQKTEFSVVVYACNESIEHLKDFESKFKRSGKLDEAIIVSLIRDSHKNKDFVYKLKDLVDNANKEAHKIMQTEANNFNTLRNLISDLLVDAKKPNSDNITNLKVLLMSSRNRDNFEMLELQFPLWKIFIDIMKNYVSIGSNIDKS